MNAAIPAFAIPGLTPDAVNQADTTPSQGARSPYPVTTPYQRFTGTVRSMDIKQIGDTEYFSVYVENNGHWAEILVATDLQKINPESKLTAEQQVQNSLTRMTKFVKHLGIFNAQGKVDPKLFGNAIGKVVEFSAKNKTSKDGKFVNTSGLYEGEPKALIPVAAAAPVAPTVTAAPDDIPF